LFSLGARVDRGRLRALVREGFSSKYTLHLFYALVALEDRGFRRDLGKPLHLCFQYRSGGQDMAESIPNPSRVSHHAELKLGGFGHPAGILRTLHYRLDVEILDTRNGQKFGFNVRLEDVAHAATRGGEREFHLRLVPPVGQWRVQQTETRPRSTM
jgi:hypothetical protein